VIFVPFFFSTALQILAVANGYVFALGFVGQKKKFAKISPAHPMLCIAEM
jgi:hypothetical protein